MRELVDRLIQDAIRDARKRLEYAEAKGYTEMAEQAQRLISQLQTQAVRFQLERANAEAERRRERAGP